ncbi:hypothetical protein QZH41_000475 [Actinostola sp. cb2023]|nr:hypothetical protein QZH41_000475 [Actinostola sp. cb2023]
MAGKIDTVVAKSLESSDYLGNNEDLQKVTNENSVTLLTMKEIDKTNKERISKKTYESTMWSFNVFKNWAKYRNQHIMDLDEQYPFVPVVDLKNTSANEMNYWLTRFILETNKGDGTPYPANSLYMIACGLLRYFRDCLERRDLNILAKGNPDFQSFQNAMYSRMKETAASGIGTKKKPAEPLTSQEEDILWSSGIIGLSSSQSLSYGVFFYNCKRFGFRSMNEHVNLMAEQYEIGSDREGEFINYTGRQVCKYMQDGVQRRKLEVKVTKHYAQPGNPHCVVNLFKVYMQCIPTAGRFYRKPLPTKELADIRFGSQPVGINVLSKYLRSMCSAANIDMDGRRFTNGSVKMTCMTTCRYYGRGECGDQTIMSHTGHQSSLVHSSKRPSSTMVKSVSDEIQPTPQPEKKSKITTESIDEDSDSDASLIIQNGDTRLLFHFDTNEDSDMDSMENSDELPSEDTKMDTSDAMPSELLSVVDALCQRTTTSSYDDDDDDDGKSSDIHDDDRGSDSIDDIEGGDNYSACKHTFDTLRETFEFGVDNNEFSNRIEEQSKNGANRISAGFCSGSSGESASADSIDLQSYEKHETRGFGDGLFKVDIPTLRTSERSSTDTLVSGITREGQERSSLPTRTVDIPTYTIEDKTIVILPDIYRVIREVCGTCSPLRGQVSKLSIVPQRFYPRHMVRLKHVGAVGLEVKCCSYILLEEFLQVIAHYKDKAISPDMINLIPAVDISATPGESNESLDDRVTKTLASKVLTEPPNPLHTFIVEDELVVCTVELQQAFESLFGNVFSVSLTKLGICQNKFTSHQLDEVMDFVDIDESNISSAVFYVTKKDAERVFQYAEALFNVAQLKTKWLDPLKLSEQTSSVSDDDKHPLHKDVIVTMVKIPANSQPHVVTTSNTISGEMSQRIESTSNSVKPVEHSALEENRRRANDKGDWVCASSSESVPGKVLESKSERTVLQQGSVSEIESHDVDSIMVLSPETRFRHLMIQLIHLIKVGILQKNPQMEKLRKVEY